MIAARYQGKNNTSVILETADAIADDRSEINLAT